MRNIMCLLLGVFVLTGCQTIRDKHLVEEETRLRQLAMSQSEAKSGAKEKVWIPAKTQKIWVNSYVDDHGDLIDGHYKYVVITPGHWDVKK